MSLEQSYGPLLCHPSRGSRYLTKLFDSMNMFEYKAAAFANRFQIPGQICSKVNVKLIQRGFNVPIIRGNAMKKMGRNAKVCCRFSVTTFFIVRKTSLLQEDDGRHCGKQMVHRGVR